MKGVLQQYTNQRRTMDDQDDIPQGFAVQNSPLVVNVVSYPEQHLVKEVNKTDILDELIAKENDLHVHKTSQDFGRRSSRIESREKKRYKSKAASQRYEVKQKQKSEQEPETLQEGLNSQPKEQEVKLQRIPSRNIRRSKQLRSALPRPKTKLQTQPTQLGQPKVHHFNRKQYHNQQILQDIEKYPVKYKIMCEVFGCKPNVAFQIPQRQAQHIQDQYTKQKGLEYLREGNAKAKYSYFRDQRVQSNDRKPRFKTESTVKLGKVQSSKPQSHRIRVSRSQKLVQLTTKEVAEGHKVYDRVSKHIKNEQNCKNYFKHLSSEESIDHALVSFLKTKIKRAQLSLK